jgi:hypothetical protein
MKYNTITKQVAATVPGGIYEGIDYHGEPPADVAARAGWLDVTPEIQAQLDAQATLDAEKAAAEAFKASIPRLVLQNIYILLCDTVYGTKDRLKRGTEELLGKAKELQAAGQKDALVNLAMLVIGLNTELVRAAGIHWWDNCEWCPHPDIVAAAEKKLAEMMQ